MDEYQSTQGCWSGVQSKGRLLTISGVVVTTAHKGSVECLWRGIKKWEERTNFESDIIDNYRPRFPQLMSKNGILIV
jgi:hypothetical protein